MKRFPLIMLAGGNGSRMGTPKGLIEYNGRPWLIQQLKSFAATHGHRVVIVLGHHHSDYEKVMPWLSQAFDAPTEAEGLIVSVVVNPHPEHGQFSSLQVGAKMILPEKFSGAYVLPVDVPVAGLEVWSHLRQHLTGDVAASIPEIGGQGGHPVLLSHRYLETLIEMPEQSRLDVQLRVVSPDRIQRVAVEDPRICMNINTPEQWHAFLERQAIG